MQEGNIGFISENRNLGNDIQVQTVKSRRTPPAPKRVQLFDAAQGGTLGADARKMRTDACASLRTSVRRQPRRTHAHIRFAQRDPRIRTHVRRAPSSPLAP